MTHQETNEYNYGSTKENTAFHFSGPRILKENIEDGVIIAIKLF